MEIRILKVHSLMKHGLLLELKIVRSSCHELLQAMMELHLIAIDNSYINPPEEVLPDGVPHQQGLWTTDSENCCFHL